MAIQAPTSLNGHYSSPINDAMMFRSFNLFYVRIDLAAPPERADRTT